MSPEKETAAKEPRGSLNMFPDLWMTKEEFAQWEAVKAKETIKAERVEGFSEEERLAYRLGVDEGLWFVALPMLAEAQAASKNLETVRAKVEAEINDCERLEAEYRGRSKAELDDEWITADEIMHRIGGLKFALALLAPKTKEDTTTT